MADLTVNVNGTIANDAVTNAKLANMAQGTVKGRAAASGTGDPQDLTADQVSTILDSAADPFVRTSDLPPGGGDVVGPGSSTDNNVPQWDGTTGELLKDGLGTSTGGNGAADAGKLLKFGPRGGIAARTDDAFSIDPAGDFRSSGVANSISAVSTGSGDGIYAQASSGIAIAAVAGDQTAIRGFNNSTTFPSLGVYNDDPTNVGPIAHFHDDAGDGMEVLNDGGLFWTSATGAQTTATNLPAFGTATKGVVPASGGGSTNFLRADGTWAAPTASAAWGSITGTLSSQTDLNSALSGKEPTISAGTTGQYWRGDKSWQTLDKSAVGLGSVENTALSTWAGSTNITTLGGIEAGEWRGTTVAVGFGGTGATTLTGIVKGNGTSAFSAAVAGTDYLEPTGSGAGLTALPSNTALYPTLNQNTTGSAATLTTARTIQTNLASGSSASFNGSANITPGVTGTLPIGNGGTGSTTRAAAEEAITRVTESTAAGSDFTTTSTSAVDVTGVSLNVASNSIYRYEVWCEWASSNTAGTVTPNLTAPSGATVTGYRQATLASGSVTNGAVGAATTAAGTANSRQFMQISGICITSGTSGTLQFTIASGSGSHTARIYAGATIRATKIQ